MDYGSADMGQDDGQQYDHTEQRRYEEEHGIAGQLPLLGGKFELMARVLNTHRKLTRIDDELLELHRQREAVKAEYDELCARSQAVLS